MKQRYSAAPADAVALMKAEKPSDGVVEQAAWMQVAATVLASDLAILVY